MVRDLFQQCGLDDPLGHFYNEMSSWKLWELDPNQSRRIGIKTLAYEWLRQYVIKIIMSCIVKITNVICERDNEENSLMMKASQVLVNND